MQEGGKDKEWRRWRDESFGGASEFHDFCVNIPVGWISVW